MKQSFLILLFASGLWTHAAPASTLIPFQGRLTDQAGNVYTNGQYTLILNLYDQAVGGEVLWTETHQKVGVINGVVNVFMGSINAALASVEFSQTRYLGITIDPDNNPSTADPEMVPRQMIIPAFWAKNSEKLGGFDWSAILVGGVNDPRAGKIPGSKIESQGITAAQLAPKSVGSEQIKDSAITSDKIADGSIKSLDLSANLISASNVIDGSITRSKLSRREVGTNVSIGGVAMSPPINQTIRSPALDHETLLEQMSVKISTAGNPICIQLANGTAEEESGLNVDGNGDGQGVLLNVTIYRDGKKISRTRVGDNGKTFGAPFLRTSQSIIATIDTPTTGTYVYTVSVSAFQDLGTPTAVVNKIDVSNVRLVAYEL